MSRLSKFFTHALLLSMFFFPLAITASSLDALLSAPMPEQTETFSTEARDSHFRFIQDAPLDQAKGMDLIPLESI